MDAHSTVHSTVSELLTGIITTERYDYLKIIVSKVEGNPIGKEFLLITRSGFQKVILKDLEFGIKGVVIDLMDVQSGFTKKFTFDVHDKRFKFLLISWLDIKEMVTQGNVSNWTENNELLDFDFDENDKT